MKKLLSILENCVSSDDLEHQITQYREEVRKITKGNYKMVMLYDLLGRCLDAFWYIDISGISELSEQKSFIKKIIS